jgi:predicted transcriptional regulator of viral defense system
MKLTDFIKVLNEMATRSAKRMFTLREISILTDETNAASGMMLIRAQKAGLVGRIKGLWINLMSPPSLEEVALSLRSLSYISFESALYKHGIISQSPRGGLTVATLQRPERVSTPLGDITYIHLPKKFFFGFDPSRVAIPEKAYLDLVYIRIRKGTKIDPEVIYFDELDPKMLKKLTLRFPSYVNKR